MLEALKTQQAPRAGRPAARSAGRQSTTQTIDELILFNGSAGAIIGLVLRNAVYAILTLGLFSVWSRTRLRRHFMGQTVFLGSRFEYTGDAIPVFAIRMATTAAIGAIAAAFALAWNNPAMLDALPVGRATALGIIGCLSVTSGLFVIHLAAFSASKHFASNVAWRGFEAGQNGSAFGYAALAVPYSLLVVLTLGLAYPFMRNRLQAYKIDHARFGRERLQYHGDARPLLRYWLVPWMAGVILAVGIAMAMATQVRALADANWLQDAALPVHAWNAFVEERTWLVLSGFILFSLAMHWYRSVESLHFANNTTLSRLRFVSRLTHADFLIAWINSIVLVAILGTAGAAAVLAAGTAILTFAGSGPTVGYALATLIFVSLSVLVLLLGSVKWFILHNLLAGASVNGLAIKGQIALDRLVVSPPMAEARREPILDMASARGFETADEPRLMVNKRL